MRDCCNIKNLSYVSASLQLVASVYVILSAMQSAAATNTNEDHKTLGSAQVELSTTLLVIIVGVCALNIALLVILIIGIKQNRISLVRIYVYLTILIVVLYGLGIAASFVLGFVNLLPIGEVFSTLFYDSLQLVIIIIMLSPIIVHFKRMHIAEPVDFMAIDPFIHHNMAHSDRWRMNYNH